MKTEGIPDLQINETMKLAINISGHTREMCKTTYPTLKSQILDKYDCDVFVSTFTRTGNRRFISNNGEPINSQKIVSAKDIEQIYSPKVLLMYDELSPEQLQYNQRFQGLQHAGIFIKPECCFDMFSKLMSMNRRIEEYSRNNNVSYDYILRLRPDIIIGTFNMNNAITKGMSFQRHSNDPAHPYYSTLIVDVTFIGDYETTIKMSHYWLKWENLVEHNEIPNKWNNAESMLCDFIKYFNIPHVMQHVNEPSSFIICGVQRPYASGWW